MFYSKRKDFTTEDTENAEEEKKKNGRKKKEKADPSPAFATGATGFGMTRPLVCERSARGVRQLSYFTPFAGSHQPFSLRM
jgi:hypothetical protein